MTNAIVTLLIAAALQTAAPRSKAEWTALRDAKFAVPAGQTAFGLLQEMNGLIGSTDPFLRDNVTYEAVAKWIYTNKLLSPDEQRTLLAQWTANLRDGIGESGNDKTYLRSFSALNLSIIAARDNAVPFLSQSEYNGFLRAMIGYLHDERDTRGYDVSKGWAHTAAHTADVLKFLARNARLTSAGQKQLLDAIAAKAASFGEVFHWGEDERLAAVLVSLAARGDFDNGAFDAWLAAIPPKRASLWANAPAVDPVRFAEVQNLTLVLRAAHAALSMPANVPPLAAEARQSILATLKAMR